MQTVTFLSLDQLCSGAGELQGWTAECVLFTCQTAENQSTQNCWKYDGGTSRRTPDNGGRLLDSVMRSGPHRGYQGGTLQEYKLAAGLWPLPRVRRGGRAADL